MNPNTQTETIVDEIKSSYDEIPYKSAAFDNASPLYLEACAKMLSLNPAPSDKAKVLEIGCSFGGNLIPFALNNPNAVVVGVDLSSEQIEQGKKIAQEIGALNLDLICKDICEADDKLDKYGKFDYIICHGVYSWVPEFVKEAILKTIKDRLNRGGVAYISYNVYPGWKIKDILKDFMTFIANNSQENTLRGKLDKAKLALGFLKKFLETRGDSESKALLRWINNVLQNHDDYYTAHEFIESVNRPLYFKDFVNDISKFDLEYLCEVTLEDIFQPNMSADEINDFMKQNLKDRIDQEQFMDFFLNRPFRKSLIVHKDTYANIKQDIGVSEINTLHLVDYFNKNGDIYQNVLQKDMDPQYNWLYEVFNQVYPSSINLSELLSELDPNLKLNTYFGFIEILQKTTMFLPKPMKVIRYKVGKSRFKKSLVGYAKYFLKTKEPVIYFANEFNKVWFNLPDYAYFVITKFDGKNTPQEIIDSLIKFIKTNKITPKDKKGKELKGEKLNKFAFDFVLDIEAYLAQTYFFEEF